MQFVPPADLADRNSSTKPSLEWVRGRYYPKVSAQRAHGQVQVKIGALLLDWGSLRGVIASETDTNVTPSPGDTRRYLPDVGFWSFSRSSEHDAGEAQVPDIPPDLAVEIVSPTESRRYLAAKVRAYVAAGSTVALVVEPRRRRITVHDAHDERTLTGTERFENPAFPGLTFTPDGIFAVLDLGRRARPHQDR